MKKLQFNTENDFLKELDGKVYAISKHDGNFLCDILEDDLIKLLDDGIIIELFDFNYDFYSFSDYIIASNLTEEEYNNFKDKYGIEIEVLNNC